MDETTPHLGLPLPHPQHDLEVDVLRLREALTGIDQAFAQQTQALEAEVEAREAGEQQLQQGLEAEAQTRGQDIQQLQQELAAEAQAREQLASTLQAGQWQSQDENFVAAAGGRYCLLASVTAMLPESPQPGDIVEVAKINSAMPIIQTTDGVQIALGNQVDTAVTYNAAARLLFIFDGTRWEI